MEHALGGMSVGTILFYLGSYHDPNDVLQIVNVFPICFPRVFPITSHFYPYGLPN
jgi:hypothetical protein